MSTVLAIIAIGVLLGLVVASMRLSYRTRATEQEQEDVRMEVGKAQHESSLRRRAEVRAAPADPTATVPSPTDD